MCKTAPVAQLQTPFVLHCIELLGSVGQVRARRMFGGVGLYVEELFVALIFEERLYLKADATSRAAFEAAGCVPFTYQRAGQPASLGYFTVPDDAMESPAAMRDWARAAVGAALRGRSAAVKPVRAPAHPVKPRRVR